MRIKVYHGSRDILTFFDDPGSPGVTIEVFGSFYKKKLTEDPVREALERVLGRGG